MDLVLKSITKEEFLKCYSVDVQKDSSHVLKLLQDAYHQKNCESVEHALLLGFSFEFTQKYVPILCDLIVEDWHCQHENIARLLQELKDPSSINCLYKTALAEYKYLDYDDSYTLAIKCIWALGDINEEYSKEKIEQLALSDNQVIKKAAEKQLKR